MTRGVEEESGWGRASTGEAGGVLNRKIEPYFKDNDAFFYSIISFSKPHIFHFT